jgi:muconolactone delta-isomerase
VSQFAADDLDAIRKRRDELVTRGTSLEDARGEDIDKLGHVYQVWRRPGESDYDFRARINHERSIR